MINESLLTQYHATIISLRKGGMLFQQGELSTSFYIVKSGKIKMSNYSEDGREFVQGYFTAGQSFGEPPFFSKGSYPASAAATEKTEVWKVGYNDFLQLLKDNFPIHLEITKTLGTRLVYKSTMLSELAIEEAEHRLLTLIRYLVDHEAPYGKTSVKLSFTRQQLADMTGLRVETVIRSIKSLEQKRQLEIDTEGKIIWTQISK
ncbi:MAG: Crp/Fnr family transcriptional regulator [Bacteroidota bacterium]